MQGICRGIGDGDRDSKVLREEIPFRKRKVKS
jgi:hypothetical protein